MKWIWIELSLFNFQSVFRVYQDAGGDDRNEKDIVRGYNFAEYHSDVYDKTESEVTAAGLDCECLALYNLPLYQCAPGM